MMRHQGIDTAARITAAQARQLRAEGIEFAGRYLGAANNSKSITSSEVTALHDAGLAILLVWERGAADVRGGAAAGARHGEEAARHAAMLGAPAETVIYFAVDYNALVADYPVIAAYLTAAQRAIGQYRVGIYGSYDVVEAMRVRVPGVAIWQCYAWSGGKWSDHADARQYAWQGDAAAKSLAAKIGVGVDLCDCNDMMEAGFYMADYIKPEKPAAEPWYAAAMRWAADAKLINDGRPKDTLTRAEMATIMQRFDARVDAKIAEALACQQPEDSKAHSGLLSD